MVFGDVEEPPELEGLEGRLPPIPSAIGGSWLIGEHRGAGGRLLLLLGEGPGLGLCGLFGDGHGGRPGYPILSCWFLAQLFVFWLGYFNCNLGSIRLYWDRYWMFKDIDVVVNV